MEADKTSEPFSLEERKTRTVHHHKVFSFHTQTHEGRGPGLNFIQTSLLENHEPCKQDVAAIIKAKCDCHMIKQTLIVMNKPSQILTKC